MAYDSKLIKRLNLAGTTGARKKDGDTEITDMMLDPRYLRQSSSLINEALQKGFDVLQLANGDIVTTGTKTVVYQYTWDGDKGKLVKAKTETSTAKKSSRRSAVEDDFEDEGESEEA